MVGAARNPHPAGHRRGVELSRRGDRLTNQIRKRRPTPYLLRLLNALLHAIGHERNDQKSQGSNEAQDDAHDHVVSLVNRDERCPHPESNAHKPE